MFATPSAGNYSCRMNEMNVVHRWAVAGRVALFMLGCAVILTVAAPLGSPLDEHWPEVVTGTISSIGAFSLTMLFVRWEGERLADVGAAFGTRSAIRFAFGFVVGLFLVAVWATISTVVGAMHWVRATTSGFPAVTITLTGYLFLACREELAFRGYPLRSLDRVFGLWFAQLFVAVVFAVEHRLGGAPWLVALLGPGLGSLLFGMAAITTKGLAVPIGMHAAWNFGQWALGLRGESGLWRAVSKGGSQQSTDGIETIIYLAVFGSATLAFWLWHRTSSHRQLTQ